MGWLIALGIILALAAFPMGVSLQYSEAGFFLKLRLWLVSVPLDVNALLSGRSRKKEPEQAKPSGSEKKPGAPSAGKPETVRPALSRLYASAKPWLGLAAEFLGDLRRKLRVDRLDCNLILAGTDPCDTAILYGSTCIAMTSLMGHLERLFVIRNRNVKVQCDFETEKPRVTARMDLSMTLGRAIVLLAGYGIRALKEMRGMKTRKGGALL